MLLAIDAGNTNVVFALIAERQILARWRIATDPRRTADEYAVWLHQLIALQGFDAKAIEAVAIATVVPRALHNLQVLSQKYFGHEALIAGRAPLEWGIELDVVEPKTVGADRVVNSIAAHEIAPDGDKIVVDFGTATTFEVVDYRGAYKGGSILPGINLSLDALVAAAAKLPRIAIEAPLGNSVIGRTTEDQMLIGIYWGYVAMIEGMVARMRSEIGRPALVIATGGLATLFEQHSLVFDRVEPDLTLRGLAIMYERRAR